MQIQKTRHDTPSFFRALLSAGVIDPKTPIADVWQIWQLACSDREVIKLSMALEKQNSVSLPSVAAPFQNGTQVLAAMSARQVSALKNRIGVK